MSDSKILVIGSSNTDMVIKLDRLPGPGETLLGGEFIMAAGGKGANQAVGAARLGGDVTFVARVGADIFGKQAIVDFKREGINTDFIVEDQEHPSGVATISVDKNGENAIAVASGANMKLSTETVDGVKHILNDHSAMLLQLETPMETNRYAAKLGRAAGLTVILNPAPAFPLDDDILSNIDILTPNESEAALLTGITVTDEASANSAAKHLQDKGVKQVIITMGAAGSYLLTDDKAMLIPSKKIDAVDTTAAGDAFNGALAFAVAKGEDLEAAVKYANLAGAFAATRIGAQPSMATAAEYAEFVK